MKTNKRKTVGVILMSLLFIMMISKNVESKSDFQRQNIQILEQLTLSQDSGGKTVCWGTTSVCYIFGCTRVNTCQPNCPLVKTDHYSFQNECIYTDPL